MTTDRTNNDRFARLASAILEGEATPAELAELDALLLADASMRDEYLDLCRLHSELGFAAKSSRAASAAMDALETAMGSDETETSEAPRQKGTKASGKKKEVVGSSSPRPAPVTLQPTIGNFLTRHNVSVGMAAGLLFVVVVLTWAAVTYLPGMASKDEPADGDSNYVALLSRRDRVVWLDGTRPEANRSEVVHGQRLAFESGMVEIRYRTGATVVIEGPADFTVGKKAEGTEAQREDNAGFLKHGSLVARCDTRKSKGFAIHTPNAYVVDQGTEFGVDVDKRGAAEVVVLSGEVDLVREASEAGPEERMRLTKNQAASVEPESRAIKRRSTADVQLASAMRSRLKTIDGGSAKADLVTQLGILDLRFNRGINPATRRRWKAGDTYRLIFATSTGIDATSADIADYNAFIQNAANTSPLGLGSVKWKALVSTEAVDARDNTSTNVTVNGAGESFWLVDGSSLVADNYADLYGSDTRASKINISETGGATLATPNNWGHTWTGSDETGVEKANDALGAGDGTSVVGLCNFKTHDHWIDRFGGTAQTNKYSLYGVSEVLKVTERTTPEPSGETRGKAPQDKKSEVRRSRSEKDKE